MSSDADRNGRASNYILGLMGDAERERAERDLEMDPAFREAVVELAERMHLFDLRDPPSANEEAMWRGIAAGISQLPHMPRAATSPAEPTAHSATMHGTGLRSLSGRRGAALAAGLAAAFALGYAAGVFAPPL